MEVQKSLFSNAKGEYYICILISSFVCVSGMICPVICSYFMKHLNSSVINNVIIVICKVKHFLEKDRT